MILQKIKKSIEKIGIPCFLDYNDATSYCAVLIPETNGKESIKVDIQFIWEDGNPILLADEWIKSLRMNKELKAIVLGSENNYAGFVLRVKVIDVSICSYIPVNDTPKYNISIDNDPTKGTVSGAGQYKEGKTCTISCTPFEQYYFDGWDKFVSGEDNWESDGTIYDNPYSFTVDQDLMFEAIYGSKYHVEVVSAGNGTVSGSGYYEPTETCTITATPNTGYHFVNWTVSGLELTTDNPYSFIPTGDITITANFIPYYDISVSSSGNGTVSGGGTYNSGETVSLTATPNEGYVFVNWTENGVEVSTSNPYTFTSTENRTIVGNFAMTPLKITTNANSSVDLINANNQTYTWNLTAGLNEYYGDVSGFALNEITRLKRTVVNSWDYAILSVDASQLTSWTIVDQYAFRLCSNLTTFILPSTIEQIKSYAFGQCGLTSITLPEGLTTIEQEAFSYCNIPSIEIPSTLTQISSSAFSPQYIRTITVDPNNAKYNDGNGSNILIETDTNTLVLGNNSSSSVVVPSGITIIGDNAYRSCDNITSITFPNSLTSIGTWAFINCYAIQSIHIPANVSSISRSFEGCYGLVSITVDSNNVKYNDGNGGNCIIETATNKLIIGCNYTTIPNSVVALGDFAFSSCTFTSITLPSSLTTIGQNVFASCQNLETITIPASVNSIGHSAFWGANMLYIEFEGTTPPTLQTTSIFTGSYPIYVPSSAVNDYKTSGNWVSYASRIMAKPEPSGSDYLEIISKGQTSVILTNSSNQTYTWNLNTGINYYEGTEPGFAINEITGLKKSTSGWDNYLGIIDASKLTSWITVEGHAFEYSYITSITLPASITTIGDYVFNNCQSLTSINLPNSITSIGQIAFNGCRSLTSITLPTSLTTIGNSAFQYCRGLTSITLPNSLTSIGNYAFSDCDGLTSITLPNSITTIGDQAFSGCDGLTSITLPEGLTTIGNQILVNCPSLTSLTIPSSVSSIGGSLTVNSPVSEVYCLPTTPPGPSPTAPMAFNSDSTVYIPNGSLSAYQNGGWRWASYNYVELP